MEAARYPARMHGIELRTSLKIMLLAIVFPTLACSEEDEPVLDERIDEGILCLKQPASDVLNVSVTIDACYSGSCSEFLGNSCSVERQGSKLVVTSVSRVKTWGGVCTDDCQMSGGFCTLEDVPAGDYQLVHGKFERGLTLPLGDGGWAEDASRWAICPE